MTSKSCVSVSITETNVIKSQWNNTVQYSTTDGGNQSSLYNSCLNVNIPVFTYGNPEQTYTKHLNTGVRNI